MNKLIRSGLASHGNMTAEQLAAELERRKLWASRQRHGRFNAPISSDDDLDRLWASVDLPRAADNATGRVDTPDRRDPWDGCDLTVMMMDGRPMWNHSKYWVRALALNALYARQHGYNFLLARPTLGPWLGRSVRSLRPALSWCKLKILAQLLGERLSQRPPRCSWVVYLDSDAVVHQHGMPLSSLTSKRPHELSFAHVLMSREEELLGRGVNLTRPGLDSMLNSGVIFTRASRWTISFLDALAAPMHNVSTPPSGSLCGDFVRRGHQEQGCLELLLRNGSVLPRGAVRRDGLGKLQLAPLQAFNSPWGRNVKHFWGGVGKELRDPTLEDELRVQGLWSVEDQMLLVDRAVNSSRQFAC